MTKEQAEDLLMETSLHGGLEGQDIPTLLRVVAALVLLGFPSFNDFERSVTL